MTEGVHVENSKPMCGLYQLETFVMRGGKRFSPLKHESPAAHPEIFIWKGGGFDPEDIICLILKTML